MLAVTAGIVCGGAVFAAEREAGTFTFLESLPATRWQLWQAKLAAGLGLAAVQIGLLVAVAAVLGLIPNTGWAVAVAVYALLAFVWGMFGSTTARTTLGSIGVAIPAAILTSFFVLIPVVVFFQTPGAPVPRMTGGLLFLACMFAVPLALSAWLFTQLDRTRAADDAPPIAFRPAESETENVAAESISAEIAPPRRPRFGLTALLWLSVRQMLLFGPILSVFALLFALTMLAPTVQPFITWPALALTAGVLAGVTAFADEQTRGAARYWGEQRLPLGRFWAFKIGLHLAFCLWLLVLLAIPLVVRTQFEDVSRGLRGHTLLAALFRAPLFDELGRQGWKYLFVPAVYGFAAGHLCGLLFRKLVVACGVAGIVGGVGAAMWGPSLLAGGVHHWQLWLPPLVALLTGRLLMRAWAADRVGSRDSLTRLVGGCAAAIAVLCAGIGYRVLEIPDNPASEDDIKFVAGLPPLEQNVGGRDFKAAAEQFARLATATSAPFERADGLPGAGGIRRPRIEDRLDQSLRSGWPEDDPQLGDFLDRMFVDLPVGTEEAVWHALVATAAQRPIGIYEYPQMIGVTGTSATPMDNAKRMAVALLARGLQRQAAGDDADFLAKFRATLALSRTLRNGSIVAGFHSGAEVERLTLVALDQWLDRLPARADKLRAAADLLRSTQLPDQFDAAPYFLAERYVLREGMKAPAQWLPNLIAPPGGNLEAIATEVDLVGVAWAVPWERERTRRIVGLGFESGLPANPKVVLGRPGTGLLIGRIRNPADLIDIDRQLCGLRRTAALKVALRAYRADHGKYPDALPDLVAGGYLRQLPADPYDENRVFGYRLAKPGDSLIIPPRITTDRGPGVGFGTRIGAPPETLPLPVGQAILWSVGPDKIDQGGIHMPGGLVIGPNRPPDIVYLVPIGVTP